MSTTPPNFRTRHYYATHATAEDLEPYMSKAETRVRGEQTHYDDTDLMMKARELYVEHMVKTFGG